jgi:hypothetical protein
MMEIMKREFRGYRDVYEVQSSENAGSPLIIVGRVFFVQAISRTSSERLKMATQPHL